MAIVALVAMLVAREGARSALAFAGAWVLSLAFTVVLLLADGADASSNAGPATW